MKTFGDMRIQWPTPSRAKLQKGLTRSPYPQSLWRSLENHNCSFYYFNYDFRAHSKAFYRRVCHKSRQTWIFTWRLKLTSSQNTTVNGKVGILILDQDEGPIWMFCIQWRAFATFRLHIISTSDATYQQRFHKDGHK